MIADLEKTIGPEALKRLADSGNLDTFKKFILELIGLGKSRDEAISEALNKFLANGSLSGPNKPGAVKASAGADGIKAKSANEKAVTPAAKRVSGGNRGGGRKPGSFDPSAYVPNKKLLEKNAKPYEIVCWVGKHLKTKLTKYVLDNAPSAEAVNLLLFSRKDEEFFWKVIYQKVIPSSTKIDQESVLDFKQTDVITARICDILEMAKAKK